jgi:hypothetical protein
VNPADQSSLIDSRRFHVALVLAATGLVGLMALLVRAPDAPAGPRAAPRSSIGLARLDDPGGSLLREDARLHDPSPLFLPMPGFNSAQDVVPERRLREPGDAFQPERPKLVFAGGTLALDLPPPAEIPSSPAEALALTPSDHPFIGFAQRDVAPAQFPPRSVQLAIRNALDGTPVRLLADGLSFQGIELPDKILWQPASFVVMVRPDGLAGEPALTTSSGVEAVDRNLLDFLTTRWALVQSKGHLTPGAYRVTLGP